MRFRIFLVLASFYFWNCDSIPVQQVSPSGSGCSSGVAQIEVGDGYLQTLCGCTEGMAMWVPPTQANCTVPTGTWIYFEYLATHLKHQIISTGEPSFASSAISDPSFESAMVRVHVIQVTANGTYGFEDAFDSQLVGNIVAQ